MTTIVGLGNPGNEYRNTRHSIGYMVVDKIASLLNIKFESKNKLHSQLASSKRDFLLVKPEVYMNDSGQAVTAVLAYFSAFEQSKREQKLPQLFVVHDDLDLALGIYKIQMAKGPKIHNGLLSIYQHLKSKQFWHVRVGIDGRLGRRSMPASEYVLKPFLPTEQSVVGHLVETIARKLIG